MSSWPENPPTATEKDVQYGITLLEMQRLQDRFDVLYAEHNGLIAENETLRNENETLLTTMQTFTHERIERLEAENESLRILVAKPELVRLAREVTQ